MRDIYLRFTLSIALSLCSHCSFVMGLWHLLQLFLSLQLPLVTVECPCILDCHIAPPFFFTLVFDQ
jgi:hypothetical protein